MSHSSPKTPKGKTFDITDLTLASYLTLKGHKAKMYKRGETSRGYPIGGWSFESTERLEEEVLEYNQGKVLVEPRDFHNALSNTRSRLLDFLGIEKQPRS